MPPNLDPLWVGRLADLANRVDGASPEEAADDVAEFNRLAGTSFTSRDFQGIHGAERHEAWVKRVLYGQLIRAADGVTRDELIEVVRRAKPSGGSFAEHEAYLAIFDANVALPDASNLIFYPPAELGDDPDPERLVAWVLRQS